MKQLSITIQPKIKYKQLIVAVGIIFATLAPVVLFAQTDSAAQKPVGEVSEAPSTMSPTIEFTSVQKADNSVDLKTVMKTKVKGTFYKLPSLKVSYVLVSDTVEKNIGFVITDRDGIAVLNVKPDALQTDKEGKLHFKAIYAGTKSLDAAEEELIVKRARLEITPVKEDSLLIIKVKLIDVGTGTEAPVKEVALGVFVQRSFNPLKVGEGTTDETGEVSVEIPNNLPGDRKGNINLMAKLEENEIYGNLEASVVQQWGIPVSTKLEKMPRALWSPHPPLWMLITFIILMSAVWGHYIVIVYQLFKLRKEEPLDSISANQY